MASTAHGQAMARAAHGQDMARRGHGQVMARIAHGQAMAMACLCHGLVYHRNVKCEARDHLVMMAELDAGKTIRQWRRQEYRRINERLQNLAARYDRDKVTEDEKSGDMLVNDRRVFRRSNLQRLLLERGEDRIIEADEHLVGDGGYTNSDFMLIPFSNNGHLTEEQQICNRALSQARVRVENAFGLAKGKWRRLKYLYIRDPALVVDHITACFVIHNFLILNGEAMINDEELRRPVRQNEILGNENFQHDPDDPVDSANPNPEDAEEIAELLRAAEDRGAEKRDFIMNLLSNRQINPDA
ncbi:Protein ANTAGONIST OF LIKE HETEROCHROMATIN PROTEIN 1 [Frankliniella fusca]|uniref:Protein ANTAGONIST OF LIKE HETEROCHROMATIN PROTEIN 1 n=1 Tax=Frankliniella fusca TaxID=407009 RepID=A0AAE1HCL1_9NEOP|nr:Protein ANTAGONIST OF LIKE HETEROCHROMATIN PROTEIN 1 [Frankliniella fusca]